MVRSIETHLAIDDQIPGYGTREITVQGWLSNGNGKTLTEVKSYPNPNYHSE